MNGNCSFDHQTAVGLPAAGLADPTAQLAAGILIADTSPLFLRGLLHELTQAFVGCPLYEAASAAELLLATAQRRPALVLLAATMARTPEALLALLLQLRQQHAPVRLIVFLEPAAGFGPAGQHALRQQVSSLLTRAASPAQVCDAVRQVLQGGLPALGAVAVARGQAVCGFSPRQLEILHLMAEEWSNEEIADFLCMSVRTVEYHRSQMLHRVGTRTTLGLVLFAQRQGLLPLRVGGPPLAARAGALP